MAWYAVIVATFCGMQAAISIFSIFAVSMIQQNTPDELIGKIMAYTSAVTLCAQPVGQMVYGFLFDRFQEIVYLVLIPSGDEETEDFNPPFPCCPLPVFPLQLPS